LRNRKLETVGIISRGISHDFNNLLAIILGNLELLKESIREPDSNSKKYVENAEYASNQASELVDRFLTMSEGGWIIKAKVTLTDILKDISSASPEIKNISFTLSLPEDLKSIFGDERQLRQVLINLLLNAYEAIPEEIKDKKIEVFAQNITLSTDNPWPLPEGEYVKVSVTDNGKGISEDLLEKIFDPYFSTKEMGPQKGMGLGLPLCYAIIKKHGGHISISSILHKGTVVDLYLPVYQESDS
jgi:two-component system, cell cycle sensor histidine kinase and response regulator CckA